MVDSTPICRCRVLYLGSAVPRQSKDGLQGIQEPLRSLYPSEGAVGAKGIDSWLSVWSNGILLENVDENLKQITRFFPIESLHYCAAVRQVLIPERGNPNPEPKFLPLDSPFARAPRAQHPPIFAAILRRTTGIKVLECHIFICKREAAANALVRCCFHAYADNSYVRQLETGSTVNGGAGSSLYGTLKNANSSKSNGDLASAVLDNGTHQNPASIQGGWRSRAGSTTTLNSIGRHSNGHVVNSASAGSASSAVEGYTSVKNLYGSNADLNVTVDDSDASIFNSDENHKIWNGQTDQVDGIPLESSYELFPGNTSTLGRPARLRQISTPVEVPPPPMKEEPNKKKKEKKVTKSSGSRSLSGTLIRPRPVHTSSLQRNGGPMMAPTGLVYPPTTDFAFAQGSRPYHTISHRGVPIQTQCAPLSQYGHHGMIHAPPPQQMIQRNPHLGMPVPVSIMMPQQYATLQTHLAKRKKKDKKNNSIPVGMPIIPSMYTYHHSQALGHPVQTPGMTQSLIGEPHPLSSSNRKLAASLGNGLDDSCNSGGESPTGTGIYKRRGHLNERAFSYSIRQEHRSRSHGSLASLQFNPPDIKKEQEIAQMVAGLDLSDGEDRSLGLAAHQQKQLNLQKDTSHHHAIYGNGNAAGIYENGTAGANNFGKPRR